MIFSDICIVHFDYILPSLFFLFPSSIFHASMSFYTCLFKHVMFIPTFLLQEKTGYSSLRVLFVSLNMLISGSLLFPAKSISFLFMAE